MLFELADVCEVVEWLMLTLAAGIPRSEHGRDRTVSMCSEGPLLTSKYQTVDFFCSDKGLNKQMRAKASVNLNNTLFCFDCPKQ